MFSLLCFAFFISFPELSEHLNQEISIRGFSFQKSDGQWMLSSEPNLRTCCIGSKAKMDSQITLDVNPPASSVNQIIQVEGVLIKKDGFFHLQNTTLFTK